MRKKVQEYQVTAIINVEAHDKVEAEDMVLNECQNLDVTAMKVERLL